MKRKYKLPAVGKILNDEPLTGDPNDPITVLNLQELPNYPTSFNEELQREVKEPCSMLHLNYNVDEEWCEVEVDASQKFHDWLIDLLPQLMQIKKDKGWKLDKTELEKTRLARRSWR